jgi:hypothetical protein
MRKKTVFLAISFALNIALIMGVVLRKKPESPAPSVPAQPPAPRTVAADPSVPLLKTTNAAPKFPPFNWKDVISDDLKVYRDRLRSLGCPDLTVHEIIKAEINERFCARRRLVLSSLQNKIWGILSRGEMLSRRGALQTEWGRQLQTLAEERAKVMDDVLGGGAPAEHAEQLARRREAEQRYSWLADEKREKIIALEERYNQRMSQLTASFAGSEAPNSDAQDSAFAAAKEEFEKARKQLLTPEELEDSRIRETDAANWAANLSGFEPTSEEWRSVAVLKADHENALQELSNNVDLSPDEQIARQKELESKLNQQIKEALGPEHFAQYELASDGRFESARSIVERFALPSEIAIQVYQTQRDAERVATTLDQKLSPADRQSALEAIRHETERALQSALGSDAFTAYREFAGGWLNELGVTSPN